MVISCIVFSSPYHLFVSKPFLSLNRNFSKLESRPLISISRNQKVDFSNLANSLFVNFKS